jgi:hypothetical protein
MPGILVSRVCCSRYGTSLASIRWSSGAEATPVLGIDGHAIEILFRPGGVVNEELKNAIDAAVKQIVEVYGFDEEGGALVESCVREVMRLRSRPSDVDFHRESLLMRNVFWAIEVGGSSPFEEEGYPQCPLTLAAHLVGWFSFNTGLGFGEARGQVSWYVDVAERGAGGKGAVYAARTDKNGEPQTFVEWPVFASLEELSTAESDFRSIARDEVDAGSADVSSFVRSYPGLVSAFPEHFGKRGMRHDAPSDLAPAHRRAIGAFAASASLARGLTGDGLAPSDVSSAVSAILASDAEDAPSLHVRLLGLVASGKAADADAMAHRIQSQALGVPLTRRWAARVLSRQLGPFR